MSLNYTTYVQQLTNLMVVASSDANFQTFLPGCIDYAEQRIYRELDLLYAQVTDGSGQTVANNRNFTLPTSFGTFITVDSISIMIPPTLPPATGTRIPCVPVSAAFIDAVYPSGQSATGVPLYYALRSNTQVIFGPSPDNVYYTEVIGIQRPLSLSSANSSTILTQYIPDVFMAASMVFAAGYQRDFGSQSDNPQMGAAWEAQYQLLKKSAETEQVRTKFQSEGWTSEQPSPIATPPRV